MTHRERLLKWFDEVKPTITSLESITELGNTRLSATVFNLRDEGYNIESVDKKVPTRWGKDTIVTEYHYHGKNS